MQITWITIQPIVALVAGILILLVPRLLNYIVAIYLIVIGISGLVGSARAEPAPAAQVLQLGSTEISLKS